MISMSVVCMMSDGSAGDEIVGRQLVWLLLHLHDDCMATSHRIVSHHMAWQSKNGRVSRATTVISYIYIL